MNYEGNYCKIFGKQEYFCSRELKYQEIYMRQMQKIL